MAQANAREPGDRCRCGSGILRSRRGGRASAGNGMRRSHRRLRTRAARRPCRNHGRDRARGLAWAGSRRPRKHGCARCNASRATCWRFSDRESVPGRSRWGPMCVTHLSTPIQVRRTHSLPTLPEHGWQTCSRSHGAACGARAWRAHTVAASAPIPMPGDFFHTAANGRPDAWRRSFGGPAESGNGTLTDAA